jgi:hypothetical protein
MKDAKKIKFERSFESKKAIDFLKKHVEKLFEIIRISNNLNLLNDNELYSLILLFDKLTRDIQNFHDLFFDPKIIKISKKNPKDKYIKKREEENIILNKKYNILISLNHTSDKKQKTILIEIISYLKHLFEYDISVLEDEFENINNIMTLKEVYDIIDKISAQIKN